MKESPIFIKNYEMLTWLLNHTRKFPKHQRFVMARRMKDATLDFHDEALQGEGQAENPGDPRRGIRLIRPAGGGVMPGHSMLSCRPAPVKHPWSSG